MSRNRFTLLLRVLHVYQNPGQNERPSSRLYKIDKMTNYFNKKMEELYQPSKIYLSMNLWFCGEEDLCFVNT